MTDLVNVNVKIGGNTQTIKMEKGVTFENKGGIYAVDDNGQLKKFDKKANVWTDASRIEMTNYQWKAFQNVANNDNDVKSFTKADIEKAQDLYKAGKFTADMSQNLPAGYKIEKPQLNTAQEMVQVNVTNGKALESATLKFQIKEISELKAASQAAQAENVLAEEPKVKPKNGTVTFNVGLSSGYIRTETYKNGKLVYEKTYEKDLSSRAFRERSYYDNGKLKSYENYCRGEEFDYGAMTNAYEFDTSGRVVKEYMRDYRKNIAESTEYLYHSDGSCTITHTYHITEDGRPRVTRTVEKNFTPPEPYLDDSFLNY